MKLKYILFVLGPCILALSCKTEDIMRYDNEEAGIYFQQGLLQSPFIKSDVYRDSTDFSFAVASPKALDTTLYVRIRTMGKVKDYDRAVKVSVDKAKTNAIEGVHYSINYNSIVIPANSSENRVPIKFNRTNDLLTRSVSLALKLEENEHFKVYMTQQKNTNVYSATGTQIAANQYRFIVGEIYTKPSYWGNTANSYFGTWTVAKYKFVNATLGWTAENWSKGGNPPVVAGRFGPGALAVRNALQALADAGTPMREADGTPMQLAAGYLVIY